MRLRHDPRRRLMAIAAERAHLRARRAVLDAQLAFHRPAVDRSRAEAVVADTPLVAREQRAAAEDSWRTTGARGEVAARLAALERDQDGSLEALAVGSSATRKGGT